MPYGTNMATYGRNEAAVTAREAQVEFADFDDGCNLPASNAPGIGISTGVVNPKLSNWTLEDQHELPRTPQGTQHIGGIGIEDGNEDVYYAVQAINVELVSIDQVMHFTEALAATPPGADDGAGVFNWTGQTLVIGDRFWGPAAA
jgi:hypothetical protein